MSLIEDWLKLCNEEEKYDSSHFYTLFHNNFSQNGIDKIFKNFSQKDDLINRFLSYNQAKIYISNLQMLEIVKLDLENKREFCRLNGDIELVESMTDVSYSFATIEEFNKLKKADLPQIWLMELIGDNQRYSYSNSIKKHSLIEAFYGLTLNNNLVWYLAKPILNSKFNPNLYFDIWKNSGDYILGNKEIYILNKNNLKA